MKIFVRSRSGKDVVPGGVEVSAGGYVNDLLKAITAAKPKYYPERQRLTLPPDNAESRGRVLLVGKKLSDYELSYGSVVYFKDLGPQIGYKTVFFWEYLGPLLVYPLFYFYPEFVYPWNSEPVQRNMVQSLACGYWTFHFLKRIVETFTVHHFSHATMPLGNLFKNCSYYWGFAAFVSYFVNHPLYTPPPLLRCRLALAAGLLLQLSNLYCHIILRNLRPRGSKEYKIPKGFLFEYVTCANYTTEIYGWLAFNLATQTLAGVLYMCCGAGQMALWAMSKHKRLTKLFDGRDGRAKYPRRWIILPPFL